MDKIYVLTNDYLFVKILDYNEIKGDKLEMTELEKLLYVDTKNYEGVYLHGERCGHRKGKKEGKYEVAFNMLKNNLSIDLIANCTGINRKEILKMKETLKVNN